MEKRLEALRSKLAEILKQFEVYAKLDSEINKENDYKKAISLIEIEHERISNDLNELERLKVDLNKFINEKTEIYEKQKVIEFVNLDPLLVNFRESIVEEDISKENQLNSRINEFANDLNLVDDNYKNKLSEIMFKLNQQSLNKKQRKLDHLTNTLDLQLDTLIGITKKEQEEEEELMDSLDDDFDDLRKESENILLERMSLDDTHSSPIQSSKKDLLILQETTTRQIVKTIENVIKDDHRYEVYKILPAAKSKDDDQYEEITVDYIYESDEVQKMSNQFEESELIETESENLRFEREIFEREKAELEKSIIEKQRHEQDFLERENLLRIEREKFELEKSVLEQSRIEIENKEKIERERNEMLRLERDKLERERLELEKIERQKRETLEAMLKIERENLEREKILLERSKIEKFEFERFEKERLERESLEMERLLKLEREKLELEKKELERQRMEKEREKIELERLRLERIELDRIAEAERARIERERIELEKISEMERLERQRYEQEKRDIERQKIEKERLDIERRRIEMENLERERLELEKLTEIERERIERERNERDRLELERKEIERRRLETEKLERERIELERRAEIEREKIERDKLEIEKEKLEIERRKLEKERLERERQELEEVYRLEEERLEREKMELERQRREKELLEKEKQELERQRIEREKLEKERLELERQHRLEKERIERERIYLENLEKERVELERQEFERIKIIEKEREERLRQERIKIEKIRLEREEKERLDRERRERERKEAEKILELKRKEREDAELNSQRERERLAEIERIENELRREKLEKLEQERLKNQEKFKLELHLKEICEKLNGLKMKILDLQITENSVDFIQKYEEEINDLDDQVLHLYNKSISLENRLINPDNTDYYLFDSLDQATLTQFELLRSFLAYLNTQINHKKKDILRRADLKIKLSNLKENLDRYIQLALKFNTQTNENESNLYVENQFDLEKRIESIESIENSLESCFKQINDLSKELKNDALIEDLFRNKAEIDSSIIQPLLMNLSRLKHCLSQWKIFDEKFNLLKSYLYEQANFGELVDLMRQQSILSQVNLNSLGLELEYEKFSNYKSVLSRKLAESQDLLMLGTNLFDLSQKPSVVCPSSCREFVEMRQLINDVSKFLDEKCELLKYSIKENQKLETIQEDLNRVKFEMEKITIENDVDSNDISTYKLKYEKLNEIKKKVRFLIDEKEQSDDSNQIENKIYESSKFQEHSKKLNLNLNIDLDNMFKSLMDKLTCLEIEYHQKIMKNLPSRNSLNDLQSWLTNATERLSVVKSNLENDRPIDLRKLESFNRDISQLKDELINEKEVELKFSAEIIENEIRQGFYDLNIQETLAQLKNDFDSFKQKLNSTQDRIDISLLKMNEFNRSINQIKYWVNNKNRQNELENVTKFKTSFEESTILMDEMTNLTCLEDDKNLIKQIINLNQELDEIRSFWVNDKIVNDPSIRVIVFDYMVNELGELKTSLEKIELFNQIKIENNLSQLKLTYSSDINELNLRLQHELNFILNGKMTNLVQYVTAVQNLKEVLEKLDSKRAEMGKNLKKFELDLKSTDLHFVINLSKNTGFLLDPHIKHSILNNLTNRDLEHKAKNLIYQAEKDLIEQWRKYDELLNTLNKRLENTHESLVKDLNNIESVINTESLLLKSNLFEQTVNDMIRNKNLFANLEQLGENLMSLSNENLKLEILKNKALLEDKFEELSELADSLSHKLEQAGQEHKNYLKLVESAEEMLSKFNKIISEYCVKDLNNQFSADIKKICSEIELIENETRLKMNEFKNLNIKDSERIERVYQLTSQCSLLLNKLRDLRLKLLDQIQERNYLTEIKLNDLQSFLNTIENFINEKFCDQNADNLLARYINCIKYLQANDLELNKWEICLDHLELEVDEDVHKQRIASYKEKIQKFRKLIRVLSLKDGLFEQLLRLKDLSNIIDSIDFKLNNDELKLINLKEDFIDLKFKIEKLIIDSCLIDFEFFKRNCLKLIESKLNDCINRFMELNDLAKKFKILLAKLESRIVDIDLKYNSQLSEFTQDLSSYEQKLTNLKDLRAYLNSNELRMDLEELQLLSDRLETSHEYQKVKIKYLDLCCDLDKALNKLDFEYDHLKQIVDKSQKLLDLIKQAHEDLAKFKLNPKEDKIESNQSLDEMLDHMKFKILGSLTEYEPVKNDILDLYSKYLTKTCEQSIDLIKDIVDKLLFEWNLINEKCVLKIKKFESFKTKMMDMDSKLNKIREYTHSMETYVRYEMFHSFDLTDLKQIMSKKLELENLLECLSKKDANTDQVFKQAINMHKANKQQINYAKNLRDRWSDLKYLIRDKLLKLSNIWLFLNDQIENFNVILNKTEDFYTNILLNANNLVVNENEIKNFELSKYSSFFRLIEDLYSTINEDNKLIKYLNESFINFSKYVHDFESTQCLEKIKQKLMDINSRWDALHNDIAIKIRMARKYQSNLRDIIDLPFNENLLIWLNEMGLLITNLEHLSTKELQIKSCEIEEIKREVCEQTEIVFRNENNILIESSLLDRMKDLMKRIIRLDSYIKQTNVTRTYSSVSNRTSEFTYATDNNFSHY